MENKVKITAYNPQDIQVAMNILNGITITGVQAARAISALASILESGKLQEIVEEDCENGTVQSKKEEV